jgi:hypothetical protein
MLISRFEEIKMLEEEAFMEFYTKISVSFVLAAFCWTKSLLCNVAAFTGMPFISESSDI